MHFGRCSFANHKHSLQTLRWHNLPSSIEIFHNKRQNVRETAEVSPVRSYTCKCPPIGRVSTIVSQMAHIYLGLYIYICICQSVRLPFDHTNAWRHTFICMPNLKPVKRLQTNFGRCSFATTSIHFKLYDDTICGHQSWYFMRPKVRETAEVSPVRKCPPIGRVSTTYCLPKVAFLYIYMGLNLYPIWRCTLCHEP